MIGLEKFDNLISLITYFKDNATCKQFLKEQRWGDDVVCPYCGHHHCYSRSNGQFRCPNCLNNFSVLVGTIFENTKIASVKWFSAITSTELGYLDGVTSNIQQQLNAKANIDHTHEIADINGLDGATLNNMISYYKFIHSAQNTLITTQLTIPETNFNHIYQWNLTQSMSTTGLIVLPGKWFDNYGEAMQAYYGWDIKIIINNGTTSAKKYLLIPWILMWMQILLEVRILSLCQQEDYYMLP